MSAGPISTSWHDHFPIRPSLPPRCVEPAHGPCAHHRDPFKPEPFYEFLAHDTIRHTPFHEFLKNDTFEHVPFDTFLERQNQEFRAAVARHNASRCPGEPKSDAIARPNCEPTPASAPSSWPHIGDVAPVTPQPPADRIRTAYQILPPIQPGRVIDLLL